MSERTIKRYELLSMAQRLYPDERIRICKRFRISDEKNVNIKRRISEHGEIHSSYDNLMRCKRAYCPSCAFYESILFSNTLARALAEKPHILALSTYTLKHNQSQSLEYLLSGLLAAYRGFTSGRYYQNAFKVGLVGSIKAIEFRYSESNGWHPHLHVLHLYSRSDVRINPLITEHASHKWQSALQKIGHDASLEHGFDFSSYKQDKTLEEYLTKSCRAWGLEREISLASVKESKASLSVQDMLLLANESDEFRKKYYEFIVGTKGRAIYQFSRGLKKILRYDEIEQQIKESFDAEDFIALDSDTWGMILRANIRGKALSLASLASDKREYMQLLKEHLE